MYIDEARVKKQFPDNLIIEVKPSIPTAMIEYNGTYLLISENGKILEKFLVFLTVFNNFTDGYF